MVLSRLEGDPMPGETELWMTVQTVVIIDEPGQARYYLLCQATRLTAPRLIRAWKRRSWIEHHFRLLKHLLAAEACQVHGEDAYDGHLVLRLLAGLVLLYTARILCKGRVTMEEIVFSLKHHWRFLTQKTWNDTDFMEPRPGGRMNARQVHESEKSGIWAPHQTGWHPADQVSWVEAYRRPALQAGVPIKVVQERLGHKRIEITLNIYAHALPSMQQDAEAKLAALLHK